MNFDSPTHALDSIANSRRVMALANVTYPNGAQSHDVHHNIIEAALDYLFSHQDISVHGLAMRAIEGAA